MTDFHWPPLESNPEVFTNYMHNIGMSSDWSVGEVFGFDEDLLAFLPPTIVGVIVAVEILKRDEDRVRGVADASLVPYYMKQTGELDNACGIIACLHACLNKTDLIQLVPDSILHRFKSETAEMTPEERATYLENATDFKTVHAAAAGEGQSAMSENQEAVKHHFIAYIVNSAGQLVELDGTKVGPHVVAEGCTDVLRGSIEAVQARLANGEISEALSMMTLNMNE